MLPSVNPEPLTGGTLLVTLPADSVRGFTQGSGDLVDCSRSHLLGGKGVGAWDLGHKGRDNPGRRCLRNTQYHQSAFRVVYVRAILKRGVYWGHLRLASGMLVGWPPLAL